MFVICIQPSTSSPINATATPVTISVTSVVQQKSNWCWAASAQMGGKAINQSSTRTQSQIVQTIKGGTDNVGGTLNESRNGTAWASHYVKLLNYIGHNQTTGRLNTTQIESNIYRGNPILAAAGYYSGSTRLSGHMVVIYGVHYTESPTGQVHKVLYIDPNDGRSYICTYNQFCNGSYNGRKYDGTVFVSD